MIAGRAESLCDLARVDRPARHRRNAAGLTQSVIERKRSNCRKSRISIMDAMPQKPRRYGSDFGDRCGVSHAPLADIGEVST